MPLSVGAAAAMPAAHDLVDSLGGPADRSVTERIEASVRAQLDEAVFEAAWAGPGDGI
jgi:hypothetical protein